MKRMVLAMIALTLLACNKIDVEEDTEVIEKPEVPDISQNDSTICTISEALTQPTPSDISIKGYIVGYVKGTSLKTGAQFGIPTEKANTNMLLADSSSNTDYTKCIAVKLEKSGNFATRNELNLYEHPELFKKYIIIHGYLDKYFQKNGITKIFEYQITENKEDGGNNSHDSIQSPGLIEEGDTIKEGRFLRKY